jgi:hypothetical protein
VVRLAKALQTWQPGEDRALIFEEIVLAQARLHDLFELLFDLYPDDELLPGISARRGFSIANLRPARRIGPNGEFGVEMVMEIVQEQDDDPNPSPFRFRGGATLIIDMRRWDVKYVVYKRLFARRPSRSNPAGMMAPRKERQDDYLTDRALAPGVEPETPIALSPKDDWAAAGDRCRKRRRDQAVREPFAVLHRGEL